MQVAEDPTKESSPQETAALLRRILTAVEKDRHTRWVEIICAVVLSLATTCSAWCAYQSTLWGGVQTFRLTAASTAGRASAAANLAGLQSRVFDATMGGAWMQARHEGNRLQEKFLYDRFRPEMRRAVDAWLKTDPFTNPNAPLGPIRMAEYVQPELAEVKLQEERFAAEYAAALRANRWSDTYVLLTVLFASVLFFGGIAGAVESRPLRIGIMGIALVLFAVTVSFLATMPICGE